MKIKHLKYRDIDLFKWDQCVKQSFNGVIYAYSWYLDVCCKDWEALVMGDYEYIMPLPKGGRFFVKYFYQPYLLPYLGIFTAEKLTADISIFFVEKIPSKFKSGKLNLNQFNQIKHHPDFTLNKIKIPQVDLITEYIYTYSKYNSIVKEKIKTAIDNKYFVSDNLSLNSFINFFDSISNHNTQKINYVRRLISYCMRYRTASILGTFNETNTLIACCIIVTTAHRAACLLPLVSAEEIDKGALHLLIDKHIKQHSSKNTVLEFFDNETLLPDNFFDGFGASNNELVEVERYNPLFQDMLKKYIDTPTLND